MEIAKINSNELRGTLFSEFRDHSSQNISWESEQIAKSHGIYLEFNRAKTGNEKDLTWWWTYYNKAVEYSTRIFFSLQVQLRCALCDLIR